MSGKQNYIWGVLGLVTIGAPLIFSSAPSIYLLCAIGALALFCVSYGLQWGQAGMLSFGHAAFFGIGAYASIHLMNEAAKGAIWLPVYLVPIGGGFAAMTLALILGAVISKKSGLTFAMITLGMGELVYALTHMLPSFFGGEGGLSANRNYGTPIFGISFASQTSVYYLIATWVIISISVIGWFSQTPMGKLANAIRDNAERAQFIGYNPRRIRYCVFAASAFFAGVAGSLSAINLEVISNDSLSIQRSTEALILTFIGGASSILGPIVGAIVGGILIYKLSDFTPAWYLYLGLFFILCVIYAPQGIVGELKSFRQKIYANKLAIHWRLVIVQAGAIALIFAGAIILVEMAYIKAFGFDVSSIGRSINGKPLGLSWLLIIGASSMVAGIAGWRSCNTQG